MAATRDPHTLVEHLCRPVVEARVVSRDLCLVQFRATIPSCSTQGGRGSLSKVFLGPDQTSSRLVIITLILATAVAEAVVAAGCTREVGGRIKTEEGVQRLWKDGHGGGT